jgi:hypothetical protein
MLEETGVAAVLLGRGDQTAFTACMSGQSEDCGAAID